MPIFEYKCESCGSKFEKLLRRTSERDNLACPDCGERHLAEQYSTFSAHANAAAKTPEMPSCPSGMCANPGFCGRN